MTEATLMIRNEDGTIKASMVRADGYPSGVGKMLLEHYQTRERVEALIDLGELHYLDERLAPNEGEEHSFEKPVEGVTVAFVRDRGEAPKGYPRIYKSLYDASGLWGNTDYLYIFETRTGTWEGNKSAAFYRALYETNARLLFPLETLIEND